MHEIDLGHFAARQRLAQSRVSDDPVVLQHQRRALSGERLEARRFLPVLQPESAARQALLGQRAAAARSQGEAMLVTRAGGDRADPLARYVVDDEFGDIAYKEKSFADRIMFWRGSNDTASSAPVAPGANESAPVDAATEAERLRALTGGRPITISRQTPRFKLPGL